MTQGPEDVLEFWFGSAAPAPGAARERARWWFGAPPEVDAELARRFGATLEAAAAGLLDGWQASARSALALVLVLDQFPRNLFRGTSRAFATDGRALAVAFDALDRGHGARLAPVETAFLLMPMQHSEDPAVHERGVRAYEALVAGAGSEWQDIVQGYLDSAREHRDIVRRFGRFPHRNAILGRTPTAAEDAYLASGGGQFGQVARTP